MTPAPAPRQGQLPPGATAYVVGGAVRDRLLGRSALDRDWVVVGSTPQAMQAAGFRPVGRDFPVFLHPATGEEYALARTERKTAAGYHGFSFHAAPDVTLEDDLARRDLTINAMAEDAEGRVIDPHGGRADLAAKVLRHVSPAFAEDPVRILRLARFAARFGDFRVAPDTLALMRGMVAAGEVDALVSERVWQELARGLMEAHPGRMLQVLHEANALPRLLPGLAHGPALAERLQAAADAQAPLPVRFAVLCLGLPPGQAPALARQLRAPAECQALVDLLAREEAAVAASEGATAAELLALLERADAWRRPERVGALLQATALRAALPPRQRAAQALALARQVDSAAVTAAALAAGARGPAVGQALHAARLAALIEGLPPL